LANQHRRHRRSGGDTSAARSAFSRRREGAAPLWFPVPAERTGRGPFPPPAGNGVVESMVWPPAGDHRYQDGVVRPEMYDVFVQTVASTATTRHHRQRRPRVRRHQRRPVTRPGSPAGDHRLAHHQARCRIDAASPPSIPRRARARSQPGGPGPLGMNPPLRVCRRRRLGPAPGGVPSPAGAPQPIPAVLRGSAVCVCGGCPYDLCQAAAAGGWA